MSRIIRENKIHSKGGELLVVTTVQIGTGYETCIFTGLREDLLVEKSSSKEMALKIHEKLVSGYRADKNEQNAE